MTNWDKFFREHITRIFQSRGRVIDIGGALRFLPDRGNIYDPSRVWIKPLADKISYEILDPVDTYKPHIVGDIHKLPFESDSLEAVICISILEHVEDPFLAARELSRVLKAGGDLFVHVPFLLYYHAEGDYYKDYWRFTEDGIRQLFKNFSKIEMVPIRGAFYAWIHLSPFRRIPLMPKLAMLIDKIFNKYPSRQTSGYYIALVK